MKKIFGVILISIYSLLFFVVLNIFTENDRYNVYSSFGFNNAYDNASIYFENSLQEDEKMDVIQKADKMVHDNEIAIIVTEYIEENGQITGIRNFVAAKDNLISEMLPQSQEFGKNFYTGNQYISNVSKEAENKIDLFTFYKGLTYEMIPFHFLEDNLESLKYDLTIHFNAEDRKLVESLIENEFSNLNISVGTMSNDRYDRNEALEQSIIFMSVIAVVIFLLFILFTISYKIKDIAILKLNGFKMKDILIYTFRSNLLSSAILALLVPSVLSFLVFRTFNLRIMSFTLTNLFIGLLFVLLFVLLIMVSTLVISQYQLSDFIKNKNIHSTITNSTYLLLILAAIVILPMVQEPMREMGETVQHYIEVRMNARKIEHVYEMRFNQASRDWEFDQLAYLNHEQNENNQRQIKLHDSLDEMNAIYHFRPTIVTPLSVDFEDQEDHLYFAYTINEKYFEESDFRMNGKKIVIEDRSRLSILMDQQTFENYNWQKSDFIRNEVDAVIYLFDQSDYLNFENESTEGYKNKEAPIFLYTENESLFIKNLSDGGFYLDGREIANVEAYLSSNHLENELDLYSLNDREELYIEGLINTLWNTGITILPGLISLFAVFISFMNFHSLEKMKEIKILKSLGYKTLAISQNFMQEILIVNIIFVLYLFLVRQRPDIHSVLTLSILSLTMVFIYIRKVSRAQIKKI